MEDLSKEQIKEIYDSSYTKEELCKKLKITTKNYYTKTRQLLYYLNQININVCTEKSIKDNYKQCHKRYCLNCGKDITDTQNPKFCSNSCAASYNNKICKSRYSEVSSNKKRISMYNKIISKPNFMCIKDAINNGLIIVLNEYNIDSNVYLDKIINIDRYPIKICPICGKQFSLKINKKGDISRSESCCKECESILRSKRCKQSITQVIDSHKHKGWRLINGSSYAEIYWSEVLDNHNIPYIREYHIQRYRLDFFIEVNGYKIDLEIDGKQHKWPDIAERDKRRNQFLEDNGFIVYRVEWDNINNKKKYELMQNKIDRFISFYNNIKNKKKDEIIQNTLF